MPPLPTPSFMESLFRQLEKEIHIHTSLPLKVEKRIKHISLSSNHPLLVDHLSKLDARTAATIILFLFQERLCTVDRSALRRFESCMALLASFFGWREDWLAFLERECTIVPLLIFTFPSAAHGFYASTSILLSMSLEQHALLFRGDLFWHQKISSDWYIGNEDNEPFHSLIRNRFPKLFQIACFLTLANRTTKQDLNNTDNNNTFAAANNNNNNDKEIEPLYQMVELLVEKHWTREKDLNSLPIDWLLPIKRALLTCKNNPPLQGWSVSSYKLIGRRDLAMQLEAVSALKRKEGIDRLTTKIRGNYSKRTITRCLDMNESLNSSIELNPAGNLANVPLPDSVGWVLMSEDPIVSARFPSSDTIEQVERLLYSSKPTILQMVNEEPNNPESSNHQQVFQVNQLCELSKKIFAMPFGRALFTFRAGPEPTVEPENYRIPPLKVSARFLPYKTVVTLQPTNNSTTTGSNGDSSTSTSSGNQQVSNPNLPPDYFNWPDFHNGVATALQMPVDCISESTVFDNTWIQAQRRTLGKINNSDGEGPSADSSSLPGAVEYSVSALATHSGFIFGLALNDENFVKKCLGSLDLYQYMMLNNELASIGTLLGCCISKRKSMDQKLSKLCSIHISSLLPPLTLELPASNSTGLLTPSALIGLGFLYQSTGQRRMSQVLMGEVSRQDLFGSLIMPSPPNVETAQDSFKGFAECYCLSAGFALGLINLDLKEGTRNSLRDLNLEERLRRCINGSALDLSSNIPYGGDSSTVLNHHQRGMGLFSSTGSVFSGGGGGGSGLASSTTGALNAAGGSGANNNFLNNNNPTGSGSNANGNGTNRGFNAHGHLHVDVTAPAAIAALTLMNLQSERVRSADILALPSRLSELEAQRPDIVLLKSLGRSLILWRAIEPTLDWMISKVPICFARDLILALEGKLKPRKLHSRRWSHFSFCSLQGLYSLLMGQCLALAFKFVSSHNASILSIFKAIDHSLFEGFLERYRKIASASSLSYSEKITLTMVQKYSFLLLLCQSLVMAGSGDDALFKRIRSGEKGGFFCFEVGSSGKSSLPLKQFRNASYSLQVIASMSLGILFLSGGLGTLKSDTPESLAFLYISLFPVHFPSSPHDNQYHLQALRHLWALSCIRHPLIVRDADSGALCKSVSFALDWINPMGVVEKRRIEAVPFPLPSDLRRILRLELLNNEDYWPLDWSILDSSQHREILEASPRIPLYIQAKSVQPVLVLDQLERWFLPRLEKLQVPIVKAYFGQCAASNCLEEMFPLCLELHEQVQRIISGNGGDVNVLQISRLFYNNSNCVNSNGVNNIDLDHWRHQLECYFESVVARKREPLINRILSLHNNSGDDSVLLDSVLLDSGLLLDSVLLDSVLLDSVLDFYQVPRDPRVLSTIKDHLESNYALLSNSRSIEEGEKEDSCLEIALALRRALGKSYPKLVSDRSIIFLLDLFYPQ